MSLKNSVLVVFAAAFSTLGFGQTIPTCNGIPATIVATTAGVINGTNGDDVIVGTAGSDTINGLAGNDTICGGGGNDTITGGLGNDTLFGQAGNDTFLWNPGDGSDRIEGSTETDALIMNGSNIAENIGLSANGIRLRLTRDIGSSTQDIAGVERVTVNPRGGSDLISIASLVGTGVQQVTLDMDGLPGGNTPDTLADSIFVFATAGDDRVTVNGSVGTVNVAGAGPVIQILNAEPTLDTLTVSGDAGNDRIDAEGLAAGVMKLIVDGARGNDTIRGSAGADTLTGGEGDDTLEWPVGTPVDLITGDLGSDTLVVVGTTASDNVLLMAAELEAQVLNYADGTTLIAAVEQLVFQARDGADQVAIAMTAASLLQRITVDLRRVPTSSSGDLAADTVTVTGTSNADNITITGSVTTAAVTGMASTLVIEGVESARDNLIVNGGAGDDTIKAGGLAANAIKLTVRGGQGMDAITGGSGDDTIVWFPGDTNDIIEGGPGNDLLQINGSNIGENINFTANGPRLRFTRDIASVVLDVAAVERVSFAAVGGSDSIAFTDLSATAVRQVSVDLAASTGGGDATQDTIAINAPANASITASVASATAWIFTWGLVRISVTNVEPALDRMMLQTASGSAPLVTMADTAETAEVRR